MPKLFVFLLLLITVPVLVVGSFAYWVQSELTTPVAHSPSGQKFEVPRGSSPDATVSRLAAAGIIRQVLPLRLYMRVKGRVPVVQAGTYFFPSPISPLGALEVLEQGAQPADRFTLIEGWTRFEIAEAMAGIPTLGLHSASEALALMNDTSRIKDLDPQAANLEGYLYPDTYFILSDTTARELIGEMVDRFREIWKAKLEKRARASGKSVHEVVTVASLIETEAKLTGERPVIASVIYNRLRLGMPLALDSTLVYASKLAGAWKHDGKVYQSDIDRDSPYNTRRVRGLPPGPVGSPGFSSLWAALNPAKTQYLYYVRNPARNDGAHNFYADAGEFEKGVAALRNWERERDLTATRQNKTAAGSAGNAAGR
ncbi:MAG TPA: endolytic transglycosylase MltG [Candidatus Obscuribacterales bacterium]